MKTRACISVGTNNTISHTRHNIKLAASDAVFPETFSVFWKIMLVVNSPSIGLVLMCISHPTSLHS